MGANWDLTKKVYGRFLVGTTMFSLTDIYYINIKGYTKCGSWIRFCMHGILYFGDVGPNRVSVKVINITLKCGIISIAFHFVIVCEHFMSSVNK